jgi:alkaline phosphatase D
LLSIAIKTAIATFNAAGDKPPDAMRPPISLHGGNGKDADGREVKKANIHNLVWLTADVHCTAAHYADPNKAQFSDCAPFWEFVSDRLNGGGFGPNKTNATLGMQFFGPVDIDAKTKAMAVALKDLTGAALHAKMLAPQQA